MSEQKHPEVFFAFCGLIGIVLSLVAAFIQTPIPRGPYHRGDVFVIAMAVYSVVFFVAASVTIIVRWGRDIYKRLNP